jgi:hypothetical protein
MFSSLRQSCYSRSANSGSRNQGADGTPREGVNPVTKLVDSLSLLLIARQSCVSMSAHRAWRSGLAAACGLQEGTLVGVVTRTHENDLTRCWRGRS